MLTGDKTMATKTRIEVFEMELKFIGVAKKFVKDSNDLPSSVKMTTLYALNRHEDQMKEDLKFCKESGDVK